MINLAINIDSNYVDKAQVTLYSILKNTEEEISLSILTFDKNLNINPLIKLKKNFINFKTIKVYVLSEKDLSINRSGNSFLNHITIATYGRLFIPKYLNHLEKIIYLDTDLVVNGNIKELWDYKVPHDYIGGVREPIYVHLQRWFFRKTYPYIRKTDRKNYINAGVMLMKPRALNETQFTEKCIEFTRQNNKIYFGDQDVINAVKKKTVIVKPEWNSTMGRFLFYRFGIIHNQYLIHYVTAAKPWKKQIWFKSLNYFLLGKRRTNMWNKYNKQMQKEIK